jgi:hypothetical protein
MVDGRGVSYQDDLLLNAVQCSIEGILFDFEG